MPLAGYSASSTDITDLTSNQNQKNASGTGFRGVNVSFANGRGSSAKADGSASSVPWYVWAVGAVILGWLVWKKL